MADPKSDEASGADRATGPPPLPAMTEAEREMAQQATEEFEAGNYSSCAASLQKLRSTRPGDPRLLHNCAVVEFYRSAFTKTDEYRKAIAESQVDVTSLSALDDADQVAVFYNHAVILYYTRQYRAALAVLDKLFTFIEPMDRKIGSSSSGYFGLHIAEESLSRKVMFLLIELHICTQQPEKALGMITLVEKHLYGNGKSQQVTPEKEGSKEKELSSKDRETKDKDSKEKESKDKETKDSAQETSTDVWRGKISLHKARCYMMLKSTKSCKREIKTLMSATGLTVPTVYLKAHFEHVRGNNRKAIKVLNTSPSASRPTSETGEALSVMYYNNLGAIHFYMKKHHLGAFYFRKALQENQRICSQFNKLAPSTSLSGRPLPTIGVSRHYELLYNLGVEMLHCSQPLAAFDCLIETVSMFRVNPRLWLRLAECCVMAHRASNDDDRLMSERLKVVSGTVGMGVHRKLLLGAGIVRPNSSSDSAAMPAATLEFAMLCLRNALLLLPEDPTDVNSSHSDDQSENRPTGDNSLVLAPPGNPLKSSEVQNLRCSILAMSAYVSLCLNDYLVALLHAKKLLQQPRLSGAHRYLGHMYMGESLTGLDRIADAITHLNPEQVTDVSTLPPEHKPDQDKSEKNGERDQQEASETKGSLYPWSPRDVTRARALMQYNLAAAHSVRGEYEKAMAYLRKSADNIGSPMPAQMYFLRIYLELMENGRRRVTQGFIKESFGHLPQNRM